MAELSTDTPARFPHENQRQYTDRTSKYEQILSRFPDTDDAAALSMVYSNMVYFQSRYPIEVEQKLAFIPEISQIVSGSRDDSEERVARILRESKEAYSGR